MIAARLAAVRGRIAAAAAGAGREPRTVTLVAVSKTQPAAAARDAVLAGAVDLGENYVQELGAKIAALADLAPRWHFIGHLQRNKARDVVGRVALVHGVDSAALLAEIERRAAAADVVQAVLLQVNIAAEDAKSGVAPAEVAALLAAAAPLAHVRCAGLMAMPPPVADAEENRVHFRALAGLRDRLATAERPLAELSMGMSDDFEVAVEEGATLLRVGTAIFGVREAAARAP